MYSKIRILLLLLGPLCGWAQGIIYVHPSATGLSDGTSWTNAYTDLQAALTAAQYGDQVWVAEGLYKPTTGTDRSVSFELKNGVRLYGGFSGQESGIHQRDIDLHPAILSGDIGLAGDSTDNTYNVLYLFEPDSNTVLDGMVVEWGNAHAAQTASLRDRIYCGGGVYIMAAQGEAYPRIQHCTFRHNTAKNYGGGVMFNGGGVFSSIAPVVEHCTFEHNHTLSTAFGYGGGGMAIYGGSTTGHKSTIRNNIFRYNIAHTGGGLYYRESVGQEDFAIQGCIFEHNRAGSLGGGAYLSPSYNGILADSCNFISNTAQQSGAAIDIFTLYSEVNRDIRVRGCNFSNNINLYGSYSSILRVFPNSIQENNVYIEGCTIDEKNEADNQLFLNGFGDLLMSDNTINFKKNAINASEFKSVNITRTSFIKETNPYKYGLDIFVKNITINQVFVKHLGDQSQGLFSAGADDILIIENSTILLSNPSQLILSNWGGTAKCYNTIFSAYQPPVEWEGGKTIELTNCYIPNYSCDSAQLLPNPLLCLGTNYSGPIPLFRDTANNDYRLLPCSPLINAGTNSIVAPGETDIHGHPRIQGGTVDLGPYESGVLAVYSEPTVQPACAGSANGSAAISPDNACEPLLYAWSGPVSGSGSNPGNLPAGNYTLTITDGKNETVVMPVTIPEIPAPALSVQTTPVLCGTNIGGTATPVLSGGQAPHQFHWSNGTTDSIVTQLVYGTYAVTVMDARGCTAQGTASIGRMGSIQMDIQPSGISCYNSSDGSIHVQPATGAPPFHWLWANGDTLPERSGLSSGVYSGMLMDALGCAISWNVPLEAPDSLRAHPQVNAASGPTSPDGSVVLAPTGGTGNIVATWPDGQQGWSVTGLLPGIYPLLLTDEKGCTATEDIVVNWTVGTHQAGEIAAEWQVWPNPATEWVNIEGKTAQNMDMLLSVSDITGRVIFRNNMEWQAGTTYISIPSGGWANGLYFVSVQSGGQVSARKVQVWGR